MAEELTNLPQQYLTDLVRFSLLNLPQPPKGERDLLYDLRSVYENISNFAKKIIDGEKPFSEENKSKLIKMAGLANDLNNEPVASTP